MKHRTSTSRIGQDPQTSTLEIRDLGIPLHPRRPARRRRTGFSLLLLGAAALGAGLSAWTGL